MHLLNWPFDKKELKSKGRGSRNNRRTLCVALWNFLADLWSDFYAVVYEKADFYAVNYLILMPG